MSQSILSTSVRSIPLALTIFRICSAPVLLWLAALGRERVFLWLAIAALLSDVLDGALARRLGAASETGRLLDSWADLLIALVSFAGATLLWPDTMREEGVYFAPRGFMNTSTAMDEQVVDEALEACSRALDRSYPRPDV